MLSSLVVRSCCLSLIFMHTSVQLGDEMLLLNVIASLVLVGVSHKLKLTSLGSHIGCCWSLFIYSFTVCIATLSLILGPKARCV